jgi:NAD(P)-dependent dehydrogenase (short-subunit alcohol dehydrogenase family)
MTEGPVTLVTGAASGIGLALCTLLDSRDHRLARTAEVADPLSDGAGIYVQADLADPEAAARIVGATVDHFGRLDNLALVAGQSLRAPLEETDAATFDRLIAVNLRAPLLLARAAHAALRKTSGRIVICSSTVAQRPATGYTAYAASKAGLEGLARALAVELAVDGIAVNVVAPGLTASPRVTEAPWFAELDHTPGPAPYGTPEEVAEALALLLDPALGRVSGSLLVVDGGLHLHPAAPLQAQGSRAHRWIGRLRGAPGRESPGR